MLPRKSKYRGKVNQPIENTVDQKKAVDMMRRKRGKRRRKGRRTSGKIQ